MQFPCQLHPATGMYSFFYVPRVTQTLVLLYRSKLGRTVPQQGILPSATTVPVSSAPMVCVLSYNQLTNAPLIYIPLSVFRTLGGLAVFDPHFYCFVVILSLTHPFRSLSQYGFTASSKASSSKSAI